MSRVSFNVGGQTFTISRELLESGPSTLLSSTATKLDDSVDIDRPRDSFGAILNMYMTGELHIPANVCPGEFKKEMEYWKVDAQYLSSCCFFRYQSFLEEQAALRDFREKAFETTYSTTGSSFIGRLRSRVWSVIDYRERTLISTIYFIVCLLMVLLSILTLALSTDRMFQRSMTNCERLEYMEAANMADIETFRKTVGQNCQGYELPHQENRLPAHVVANFDSEIDYDYDDSYHYISIPAHLDAEKSIIKTNNNSGSTDNDTQAPFLGADGSLGPDKIIKVPNMKVPINTMFILEVLTVVFFTTDFILRLSSCPSLVGYFKSVVNILDAAALLCTYFHYLAIFMNKQNIYKDSWLDLLAYTQMLRALRLFRVVKNVKASRVLVYSIRQNLRDLSIICIYIVVCMCVFASMFYIAEGKTNVRSLPRNWYYTIITLTTVGYGDITPSSKLGKAISCLCAISGLLLFALTIPIIANNFLTLYKYAYTEQKVELEATAYDIVDKRSVQKKKKPC